MDYTAWCQSSLQQMRVGGDGAKTSIWHTVASDKPLVVLVHGMNGDYHGMVPLAAELASDYRVAIVELPGHGSSDPIPLPGAADLRRWFQSAYPFIQQEFGHPAFICGHSFGGSALLGKETLATQRVVLFTPAPTPSRAYSRYARLIMRTAAFWSYAYNWRPFIYLRGSILMKIHTPDARRRVRWVGQHIRTTRDQLLYQGGLANMILDGSAYRQVTSGSVALAICGTEDSIAQQRDSLDMQKVFGVTPVVFLRGGHLLPIESPQRVAAVIRKNHGTLTV